MTTLPWDKNRLAEFRKVFINVPQPNVGRPCGSYLKALREIFPDLPGQRADALYPEVLRGTNRDLVRKVCRDPNVHVLEAYAVAMAWGGQWKDWFLSSIQSPRLERELKRLRSENHSRQEDFAKIAEAAREIKGLGISFFTKLLFFFRPKADAYILDQFTAKSMVLLRPGVVWVRGHMPAADTLPEAYENFCRSCDELAFGLSCGSGEAVERAMFDHRNGRWRAIVRSHYPRNGRKRFDKELFLQEVAAAHGEAETNGPSVPQGILRCDGSRLWLGGKGAAAMMWYYKAFPRKQCVEVGVRFARSGLKVLREFRAADNDGVRLLTDSNHREDFPGIIECIAFDGKSEYQLAGEAIKEMSGIYKALKILATSRGIDHVKLS